MYRYKTLVSCTQRKCVVVNYTGINSPFSLSERVINLGEIASSITVNFYFAYIGVVDSSKNTMAFYRIDELAWPDDDLRIREYFFTSFRRNNAQSCRADHKLVKDPLNKTASCLCADGFYWDFYRWSCELCHENCKYCIGPGESRCRACPVSYSWSENQKACYNNNNGTWLENEENLALQPQKCLDLACEVCSPKDANVCFRCKYPYKGITNPDDAKFQNFKHS